MPRGEVSGGCDGGSETQCNDTSATTWQDHAMGATPHDRQDQPARSEVCSVGRLTGGLGATPGAAEAMARSKLNLSNHVSAQLSPQVLADAHLVLVMERGHLSDVYQTQPDAIDCAFTLGEFPSLLRTIKRDPTLTAAASPLEGARRRIALANQGRDPVRILIDDESSDIADPMGRWALHYRRTAKQLSSLIDASLDGLFP